MRMIAMRINSGYGLSGVYGLFERMDSYADQQRIRFCGCCGLCGFRRSGNRFRRLEFQCLSLYSDAGNRFRRLELQCRCSVSLFNKEQHDCNHQTLNDRHMSLSLGDPLIDLQSSMTLSSICSNKHHHGAVTSSAPCAPGSVGAATPESPCTCFGFTEASLGVFGRENVALG